MSNSLNPDKQQKPISECKSYGGFSDDKDDIKAREGERLMRNRQRWRDDASIPPERIALVVSELGQDPEMGIDNHMVVTQASNSKITWNAVTKQWELLTSYSQKPQAINKLVRVVSSGQRGNRQGGGSW